MPCPKYDHLVGVARLRCDVPEEDDAPILAFYCPACAEREFGTERIPGLDPARNVSLDDPSASGLARAAEPPTGP